MNLNDLIRGPETQGDAPGDGVRPPGARATPVVSVLPERRGPTPAEVAPTPQSGCASYVHLLMRYPEYRAIAAGLFLAQTTRWVMAITMFTVVVQKTSGVWALFLLMVARVLSALPAVSGWSTLLIKAYGLRTVALVSVLLASLPPIAFGAFESAYHALGMMGFVLSTALVRFVEALLREVSNTTLMGLRRGIVAGRGDADLVARFDGVVAGAARAAGALAACLTGFWFIGGTGQFASWFPYALALVGNLIYGWTITRAGDCTYSAIHRDGEQRRVREEFTENWAYAKQFPGLLPMLIAQALGAATVWVFGGLFAMANSLTPDKWKALAMVSLWLLMGGVGNSLGGLLPCRRFLSFCAALVLAPVPALLIPLVGNAVIVGALYGFYMYLAFCPDVFACAAVQNHRPFEGLSSAERAFAVARVQSLKGMLYEASQLAIGIPVLCAALFESCGIRHQSGWVFVTWAGLCSIFLIICLVRERRAIRIQF